MPVTMGSLNPVESEKIRKNRPSLLSDWDVQGIMDYCVNEDILTIAEVIELDDDGLTKRERNKKFLDLLSKSGDNAYSKFIKLLKNHGGGLLAKQLQDTVVSSVQATKDQDKSSKLEDLQVTEEEKESRLTPKDLVSFAKAVPLQQYQVFGQSLNLSKNDIDSIHLDYHHYGAKTELLQLMNKWMTRSGKSATVGALLTILQECDLDISWEEVTTALQKKFGKK